MESRSMSSTRTRNWNMKKLIPLSLAAVFALTSGFTMAAAPQATQTKVVKKHHKATHAAPAVKVAPKTK